MKGTVFFLAVALWLAGLGSLRGQGSFQNLDFESANVAPLPPGQTELTVFGYAFPNWIGFWGTLPSLYAINNGISVGEVAISIIGHSTSFYSNNVIAGSFTATLSAGFLDPEFTSASIAQSGQVPLAAQSLRFSASSSVGDLTVTFNGQNLPFFALSAGTNYQIFGADIASFAGQTGELRFTENPGVNPFSSVFLDDILFSAQPIPEPSVLGLLALGALLLGGISKWIRHWAISPVLPRFGCICPSKSRARR